MKLSLFVKTLLWFLLTAFVTMAAVALSAAISFNRSDVRPPIAMLMTMQLMEARYAYETYGPEGLQRALRRFERITQGDGILTDASGFDLVTGEDRRDLVQEAMSARSDYPMLRRSRAYISRRSPDGRYWYFLALNRQNWLGFFIQPRNYLIIFGTLALLCYAFARHLTNPVKRLQTAVESFGRGDLTARVNSTRRDELGQLARTFNQMAGRIQTLLEAERRLLLDISHELRSPLARLSVAVELARTDPEKQLSRIQKEADRLNSLVGELLQVTRAEGDPEKRRMEDVDLVDLVSEVVADCRIEAEARGCRIEVDAPESVVVKGDDELLRRAIENVLRNAIRYEPPDSAVEVSIRGTNVTIRDHGPGVPSGAESRIFDAFYRVESDRNRGSGGVGLGLSIARRAIELHKGRIEAVNCAPGLEVRIQLPG